MNDTLAAALGVIGGWISGWSARSIWWHYRGQRRWIRDTFKSIDRG